jgi:excisionase family DNA binding protein
MTSQVKLRRDRRRPAHTPVSDNGHDKQSEAQEAPKFEPRLISDVLRNPVLKPSEVAALLRLDVNTILRLARDGHLPSIRIDKHVRFLRKDVLEQMHFLRSQKLFEADLRQKKGS